MTPAPLLRYLGYTCRPQTFGFDNSWPPCGATSARSTTSLRARAWSACGQERDSLLPLRLRNRLAETIIAPRMTRPRGAISRRCRRQQREWLETLTPLRVPAPGSAQADSAALASDPVRTGSAGLADALGFAGALSTPASLRGARGAGASLGARRRCRGAGHIAGAHPGGRRLRTSRTASRGGALVARTGRRAAAGRSVLRRRFRADGARSRRRRRALPAAPVPPRFPRVVVGVSRS